MSASVRTPSGWSSLLAEAYCESCGWRGPLREWSLYNRAAERDARDHNEQEHGWEPSYRRSS